MRAGLRTATRSNHGATYRELLGDIFRAVAAGRRQLSASVAGTHGFAPPARLRSKGPQLFSLFRAITGSSEIEEIIAVVAEELLAAVAGISATAEDGRIAHLELLLLPFNSRAHTPPPD